MTIEAALQAHLTGAPAVAALIGSRLYPLVAPAKADRPYATWQRISSIPTQSLDGPNQQIRGRFQIDAWSPQATQARALAMALRTALDGFRGTVAGVTFQASSAADDRDFYDDEAKLYRASQDFILWYVE